MGKFFDWLTGKSKTETSGRGSKTATGSKNTKYSPLWLALEKGELIAPNFLRHPSQFYTLVDYVCNPEKQHGWLAAALMLSYPHVSYEDKQRAAARIADIILQTNEWRSFHSEVAAAALVSLGLAGLQEIEKLVADPVDSHRYKAITHLSATYYDMPERHTAILEQALADPHPLVRWKAQCRLNPAGAADAAAFAHLQQALHIGDPAAEVEAVLVLGELLEHTEAQELLKQKITKTNSPSVREAMAVAAANGIELEQIAAIALGEYPGSANDVITLWPYLRIFCDVHRLDAGLLSPHHSLLAATTLQKWLAVLQTHPDHSFAFPGDLNYKVTELLSCLGEPGQQALRESLYDHNARPYAALALHRLSPDRHNAGLAPKTPAYEAVRAEITKLMESGKIDQQYIKKLGPEVPVILEELAQRGNNTHVRTAANIILNEFDPGETDLNRRISALSKIIQKCRNEVDNDAIQAAQTLGELPSPALDVVNRLMRAPRPWVRHHALWALFSGPREDALPLQTQILVAGLKDKSRDVKWRAVSFAGRFMSHSKEVRDEVAAALFSGDSELRWQAVLQYNSPDAINDDAEEALLKKARQKTGHPHIMDTASLEALVILADHGRAIPAVLEECLVKLREHDCNFTLLWPISRAIDSAASKASPEDLEPVQSELAHLLYHGWLYIVSENDISAYSPGDFSTYCASALAKLGQPGMDALQKSMNFPETAKYATRLLNQEKV